MILKSISAISILVLSVYARNMESCTEPKATCPTTEDGWKQRASEFSCSAKLTYVCILNNSHVLVETCMADIFIHNGTEGCPIIFCTDKGAILPVAADYLSCPGEKPGCPPSDHSGYYLHDLFMYPACITTEDSNTHTTTQINTIQSTTKKNKTKNLEYGLGFGVPIAVLVLCGVGVYGLKRFYNSRRKYYKKKSKRRYIPTTSSVQVVSDSYDQIIKEDSQVSRISETDNTNEHEGSLDIYNSNESDSVYVAASSAQENIVAELQRKNFAVVVGYRGSGKISLALRCMSQFKGSYVNKIARNVKEFADVLSSSIKQKTFLILRDILGKDSIKEKKIDDFEQSLESLMWKIANENWRALIIVRDDVFPTFERCLERYNRFTRDNVFMLSDPMYKHNTDEKKNMVQNYARRFKVEISDRLILQVAQTDPLDFPLRCVEFFKRNQGRVVDNIDYFTLCGTYTLDKFEKLGKNDPDTFCALVTLLFLSNRVMPREVKVDEVEKVIQVLDNLFNSHVNDLCGFLRIIEKQVNVYVVKLEDGGLKFISAVFEQAVLLTFWRWHLETLINLAPLHILQRCSVSGQGGSVESLNIPKRLRQKYDQMLKEKTKAKTCFYTNDVV